MRRRSATLRFVSLLALGALVLHDLRYRVGYQEHAGAALRAQGHAYLPLLGAFVASVLASALASFGAILIRARRSESTASSGLPFARTWGYSTVSLAAIYVTQEWLEGQLAPGHPAGLAGVIGHAGWVALLLAGAVGAAIALLLRGADAVVAFVSGRAVRRRRSGPSSVRRPPAFAPPTLDVLACKLAARAPPLLS
jgi:hypothetical protein